MKKFLLPITILLLTILGCDRKTPSQCAKDDVEQYIQSCKEDEMKHERYIDSLVNVATGLDGETLVRNRQNALGILRKEYPQMNEKWDSVQESICNGDLY